MKNLEFLPISAVRKFCDPDWNRTSDLKFRKRLLYPTELQGQKQSREGFDTFTLDESSFCLKYRDVKLT